MLAARGSAAQMPQVNPADPEAQMREEAATREEVLKRELARAILAARETAAGRPLSPRLRTSLTQMLVSARGASLEAFASAGGLGDIEALARETSGPRVLGDSGADLIFTPVAPCRIVNTTVAGGVISANTTRSFFVNGSTAGTFEAQGGTAGGCGIPDDATAVAMNFVAVGPAGPGDFRAFPWNATPTVPNASIINYANVPGLNIANGLAQPVCNAATTTCSFDLIVQADVSASHLVVDVVGYYRKLEKAQVKSFVVAARAGGGTTIGTTCTNHTSITVDAPVAGQVLVRANVAVSVVHTTGTSDWVTVSVGTTPTDCQSATQGGFSQFTWVDATVPSGSAYPITQILRLVSVSAGPSTFYINAFREAGSASQFFYNTGVDATFIPN